MIHVLVGGEGPVKFFGNLRIAQKVLAGLSLLALLSVFIAGFGAYQLSIMAERSATLVDQQARSMKLAALANENKSRLHQMWYATVIENDVPDFRQQLLEIAAERRELDGRLQELRQHMRGRDFRYFELLEHGLADYYSATEAVPGHWYAGRKEEAEDVIQHPAQKAYTVVDEALTAIVASQDRQLQAGAAAAAAHSVRSLWTLVIVALVGLASICALVVVIGRGFAVVADLVSALAMRAEEEAQRARQQLTLTQTDIVAAAGAVQHINEAFSTISNGVGEVHELLDTMALANQAQATAITQVSAAMAAMDLSTQQNAAMVEQTSAATRNLSGEVEALFGQAERFRIVESGGSGEARQAAATDPSFYLPEQGRLSQRTAA
jgi:hypothetical protein